MIRVFCSGNLVLVSSFSYGGVLVSFSHDGVNLAHFPTSPSFSHWGFEASLVHI